MFCILFRKAVLLLKRCLEIVKTRTSSTTQDIAKNVFGHVFEVVNLGNTIKSGGFRACFYSKKKP